jgi:GDP-4-dehydro-6-deoxy-D-mannose reductase
MRALARAKSTWSARSRARSRRPRQRAPPRSCCAPAPYSARDFIDVRDVVRAYLAAVDLRAGVYNVCSGRATSVRELVELVGRASTLPVRHEIDPNRVCAHDVPELRGSAERLRAASDWRPEIPLERTVADALEAWRRELGG